MESPRNFYLNWRAVKGDGGAEVVQQSVHVTIWQEPSLGWMKVNVDAALNMPTRRTWVGWVIRNSDGSFYAACSMSKRSVYTPKEVEAMGIREVLSWCKSKGLDFVQVEKNSLVVFSELTSVSNRSTVSLLVDDVKELLKSFEHVTFLFAKRSTNKIAHVLARDALFITDCREWIDILPICILDALCYDSNE